MWRWTVLFTLLSFNLYAVEVNTGNILSNSTFGTGTTYSTDNWTISNGTSGHNYMSSAGGNDPGGSVAAQEDTVIEQTVDSLANAAGMTVNEIRKGWSSTMSTDVWFWNQYDNTTTLKQTITDSDGNVTIQQRVIEDTGCGSINCDQYTNYTDTYIQGANSSTDFSIKAGVHNTNNRSGHYGPDIDDIELNIAYTDVPPIDEDTQEDLDDITEGIEEDIPDFEDIDDIEWEEEIVFEEEFEWEEDFYFEEEFDMEWEEFDTTWSDYEMEFNDDVYLEEEFTEFEEMEMPEEFEMTMMPEDSFEEMYMEEFEEFETFEDVFSTLDGEEMEMFEEMEEPEMEMEEEMEEPEPEMEVASNEEDDMMTEEPETEMEKPENEEVQNEESNEATEEPKDEMEEESDDKDSPSEVAENENEEAEPDSEDVADADVQAEGEAEQKDIQKAELKGNRKISIDEIKVKKVKVNVEKVTLFSDQGSLQVYETASFYQPEQIYTNVDTSFFDQIDMVEYNKQIYQNVRLASYMDNDPVEVHRKNMERINMEKQRLLIELRQLRNQ